ncbi:recombination mediator RecR [Patescibacteria group bacterium]|nr:recombination mediator RecR [Patescibacteria group bacterium]
MSRIPEVIGNAASEFDGIPGVGPRAALRYAFWLVSLPKERIRRFAQAMLAVSEGVTHCRMCGAWSTSEICIVCADPGRDVTQLCVVATDQDMRVVENSGAFRGRYHILGGLIDPIEGTTPDVLSIDALIVRVSATDNDITEVVLAFDPDVRGDATALFIAKRMQDLSIGISRLARGLPTGAQIEYADETTVADAFTNRRKQ